MWRDIINYINKIHVTFYYSLHFETQVITIVYEERSPFLTGFDLVTGLNSAKNGTGNLEDEQLEALSECRMLKFGS